MTDQDTHAPAGGHRWLKGGCGCAALLFGALIVFIIFLPRALGSVIARGAVSDFNEQHAGSLSVPAMRLGWSSPQLVEGIELHDPSGRKVFSAALECPSIFDIVKAGMAVEEGGPIRLGKYRLELEADVLVDDEGHSNLEAALERKVAYTGGSSGATTDHEGDQIDPLDILNRIELEFEFLGRELRWTDPQLDVQGNTVALHDVNGLITFSEGVGRFELEGVQECETRGPFAFDLELADFVIMGDEPEPGSWHAEFSASELSVALVDRLAELDGEASALLGERFAIEAEGSGEPGEIGSCLVELRSEVSSLRLAGTLSKTRLELTPAESGLALQIDPAVFAERLQVWSTRALPEGMAIEVPSGELALELRELSFGIDPESESLQSLQLGLELELGAFSLIDPLANGSGEALELEGLELSLTIQPEAPFFARASALVGGTGASAVVELELAEDWAQALDEQREQDLQGELRLTARDLPVDLGRKLALIEDPLEELIGNRLDLNGKLRLANDELEAIALSGESEQLSFSLEAALMRGRLVLAERGLVVDSRLTKGVFAELMGEVMPEGSALTSPQQELSLGLVVDRLVMDLAQLESDEPFKDMALDAKFTSGALDYSDAVLSSNSAQLSMSSSQLQLELDRSGALEARFEAGLNTGVDGGLVLSLSTVDGAALLTSGGLERSYFELSGDLRGFSTRVLDAYAEQDGLLLDVLGPVVDATLAGDGLTTISGPLVVNASSERGSFAWRGRYDIEDDGQVVLTSGEGGELKASLALSPLFSERIVGSLVPVLVNLNKPDGAPVWLSATDLRLPLNGDLHGLEAKLTLDLGQVTSSFLPSLASELSGLTSKAVQSTDIAPIEMRIANGLVQYDSLPIKVDGRPLNFAGSYNLLTKTFDLTADVRLADLGGEAGKLLKSVRKSLGDDYTVPIHIGGTASRPRVGLKAGFLESALKTVGKQKLENELSRGLRKLFGD